MSNCTHPTLSETIEALQPSPRLGDVRCIAAALPSIELAFSKGVSRETVHQALKASGLQISFQGFVKALYRLRKKAKASRGDVHSVASAAPAAQAPATPVRTAPHPLQPGELRDIARNRPDLNELSRIAREAAKSNKAVSRVSENA